MGKSKITLDTNVDIRTDYLRGLNQTEISDKYKVSTQVVAKILSSDDRISRRLAEEKIQKIMNKETEAIVQIKDNVLQFISLAVKSATEAENPHLFLKDVSTAMKEIDRIQRLNQSKPTDIKEDRSFTTTFDVNEAMEKLKTNEDKMDFLRRQLNPQNYDRDSKDIGGAAEGAVVQAA